MENIILIGFMGSGKTSVAKALADKLNMEAIDTDTLIEETTGLSIDKIFEEYGEDYFRTLETKVLMQLLSKEEDGKVIALGGGTLFFNNNKEYVHKLGKVFFLESTFDNLLSRIVGDAHRPLANKPKEEVRKLFLERNPYYAKESDIVINTDDLSIDEIVKLVEKEVCHE